MMSNITQIEKHNPDKVHKILDNLFFLVMILFIQIITNKVCNSKFIRITPIKTLNQYHSYLFSYPYLLARKILNNLL